MKKISYFLVLFISIFSLNMLVSAECSYDIVMNPKGEDDKNRSFTYGAINNDNMYAFLRAFSSWRKDSNMGNSDFKPYMDNLNLAMFKNANKNYNVGDADHVSNNVSLDYNGSGAKLSYTVYDFGTHWGSQNGGYDKTTSTFQIFNNNSLQTRGGKCPDAVSINVFEKDADICKKNPEECFTLNKELYLSDYNYNYMDLIADGNFGSSSNTATLILYNKDYIEVNSNGDKQKNKNVLNAVSCKLNSWSSGFATDSMDMVKNIIDGATANEEYNIRTIYSDVATLSAEEAEKTIEKVKNGETISKYDQKMIYNYILTLPYFKEPTAADAYSKIKKDKEVLEEYNSTITNFEGCIATAYGYTEKSPKEAIRQFMQYDKEYQGLYVAAMINLLDIFTEENVNKWYEAKKETDYVDGKKSGDDSACSHVPSDALKACLKQEIEKDVRSINCTDLIGKTNLTPAEKILADSLSELCSNPKDYNCYLTKCNEAKYGHNVSKDIEDLVDGNTDAQNQIKTEIDDFYSNIIEHTGIKLASDLCEFFKEGKAIRDYTDLGLLVIKIAGPILVIFLTALDAIKSFASQKDDENKKFFSKLKTRLICVALLFLIPTILQWLLELAEIKSC